MEGLNTNSKLEFRVVGLIESLNNLNEAFEDRHVYEDKLKETIDSFEKSVTAKTKEERIDHYRRLNQGRSYLGEKLRGGKGGHALVEKMDEAIRFIEENYDIGTK